MKATDFTTNRDKAIRLKYYDMVVTKHLQVKYTVATLAKEYGLTFHSIKSICIGITMK